ncbi:hypothetical protein CROQUDRAFT_105206 [Cronartium quercuum f. sp. fusiforme G11]|uniref:Uncharacterized protein n=1 Tax=Cronartium quercuum f. sp. fusiforme G11 TaxID=708437 RepID=A0A9P6TEA0_9BASI|nr:hypothetical protein CROQUDRAFT_105206 [Cronartium quercuum f. sp. fusiforme G11]
MYLFHRKISIFDGICLTGIMAIAFKLTGTRRTTWRSSNCSRYYALIPIWKSVGVSCISLGQPTSAHLKKHLTTKEVEKQSHVPRLVAHMSGNGSTYAGFDEFHIQPHQNIQSIANLRPSEESSFAAEKRNTSNRRDYSPSTTSRKWKRTKVLPDENIYNFVTLIPTPNEAKLNPEVDKIPKSVSGVEGITKGQPENKRGSVQTFATLGEEILPTTFRTIAANDKKHHPFVKFFIWLWSKVMHTMKALFGKGRENQPTNTPPDSDVTIKESPIENPTRRVAIEDIPKGRTFRAREQEGMGRLNEQFQEHDHSTISTHKDKIALGLSPQAAATQQRPTSEAVLPIDDRTLKPEVVENLNIPKPKDIQCIHWQTSRPQRSLTPSCSIATQRTLSAPGPSLIMGSMIHSSTTQSETIKVPTSGRDEASDSFAREMKAMAVAAKSALESHRGDIYLDFDSAEASSRFHSWTPPIRLLAGADLLLSNDRPAKEDNGHLIIDRFIVNPSDTGPTSVSSQFLELLRRSDLKSLEGFEQLKKECAEKFEPDDGTTEQELPEGIGSSSRKALKSTSKQKHYDLKVSRILQAVMHDRELSPEQLSIAVKLKRRMLTMTISGDHWQEVRRISKLWKDFLEEQSDTTLAKEFLHLTNKISFIPYKTDIQYLLRKLDENESLTNLENLKATALAFHFKEEILETNTSLENALCFLRKDQKHSSHEDSGLKSFIRKLEKYSFTPEEKYQIMEASNLQHYPNRHVWTLKQMQIISVIKPRHSLALREDYKIYQEKMHDPATFKLPQTKEEKKVTEALLISSYDNLKLPDHIIDFKEDEPDGNRVMKTQTLKHFVESLIDAVEIPISKVEILQLFRKLSLTDFTALRDIYLDLLKAALPDYKRILSLTSGILNRAKQNINNVLISV